MRYEPDELFASTAPKAKHRAGYSPEFFTHYVTQPGLDGTQTALDLGTGTGAIAIPLAMYAREVIAANPYPSMLEEGRKLSAKRGITTNDWRLGDSHHLSELTPARCNSSPRAKISTGPTPTPSCSQHDPGARRHPRLRCPPASSTPVTSRRFSKGSRTVTSQPPSEATSRAGRVRTCPDRQ
ncbi:hypothetical protein BX286_6273 [Streptomyces sp. 3211.6]|nr:hypothetical protein BX286_6273 [Streptomyces sp. 3211.6]